MKNKTSETHRLDEMIVVAMKVARGDYAVGVRLTDKNDEYDSLAMALNMMADDLEANTIQLSYVNSRADEMLNVIQRLARGDYAVTCELGEENDIFDALALGLNMMVDDIRTTHEKLEASNKDLRESLAKVNTLSGLLPICAWCKKLRDDKGYWKSVEAYISAHTGAEFTHGMCPECQNKYFTEHFTEENSNKNNNSKVS